MATKQLVPAKTGRCDLYFLIYPDAETRAQAADLGRNLRAQHRLTGPLMAEPRLHISLNGLGRWPEPPEPLIDWVSAAASRVRMAPFKAELDRIERWSGGQVVALGDDGLTGVRNLRTAIHGSLVEEGIVRGPEKVFTPHLTLLRETEEFPGEFIRPLSWTVSEFVLVGSFYGQGRHEIFGRWSLTG